MYEQLLRDLQSAGNAGEFYTPRPVTEFMVRMVDPQLDEKVMDPACGTGGFLTCTIEHKRRRYVKTLEDERVLQASIHGVEKKPLPHLLATTNMILHGIEVPSQIRHDNTLAKPLIAWGRRDRVHCIVANPPFGGMEEDGIENNFPQAFRTRETADLFLLLIMHLLRDGGRAAVVLPDGFLFGEGIKSRIKEKLLAECNLHTIVRLPNGVFNPYTGIKTNLLFFTKGTPTKDIWFYEHQYPAGVKNYSKTRPLRIEEFDIEQTWWGSEADGFATRVKGEFAWKISAEEIKARNYNLDCKNPHVSEQVNHDPAQLLKDHARIQADIHGLREQLKTALAASLTQSRDAADFRANWQQLVEHFHTLFTTEASIGALKQTVLQLGVRGKLVPQNRGGETAVAFLKSRGIKTYSHELPGWASVPLGSLGTVLGGATPSKANPAFWSGDIPWVSPKDMKRAVISDAEDHVSPEAVSGSALKFIPPASILMVVRGMILAHSFPVALTEKTVTINQDMKALVPPIEMARYLLLYLQARKPEMVSLVDRSSHGTCKLVSDKLWAHAVAVPPLAEQERIVAKVDELLSLCDQLKRCLATARMSHEHLAQVLVELTTAEEA